MTWLRRRFPPVGASRRTARPGVLSPVLHALGRVHNNTIRHLGGNP